MGWHVRLTDDVVSLHRLMGNGEPRQTPDVCLDYEEDTVFIISVRASTSGSEERKPDRHYRLASRLLTSAVPYQRLSAAVTAFMRDAKALAPVGGTHPWSAAADKTA